jgi:hypothetical protein
VSALTNQISDDPVLLALLNPTQFERQQLAPPKPTAQEHGQHRVIAELASTTVRFNASRGSEQYQATNSRIAWS